MRIPLPKDADHVVEGHNRRGYQLTLLFLYVCDLDEFEFVRTPG